MLLHYLVKLYCQQNQSLTMSSIVTPPPMGERSIVVTVATPVHAYLRNYMSDLHQISLHVTCMSVARSSSGGVVIRYVVPVLLMTSRLYIMARNISDAIVTQ